MPKEIVWSPLIRALHWIIALLTPVLFISAEADVMEVHLAAGPILMLAVLVRIWIGFTGEKHERFSSFFQKPSVFFAYLNDTINHKAKRTRGHNPLAGPVMAGMLLFMLLNSISGEFLRGAHEEEGPFVKILAGIPDSVIDPIEIIHSSFGHIIMALALIHIAGIIVHTITHKEMIARAMINGEKIIDETEETK